MPNVIADRSVFLTNLNNVTNKHPKSSIFFNEINGSHMMHVKNVIQPKIKNAILDVEKDIVELIRLKYEYENVLEYSNKKKTEDTTVKFLILQYGGNVEWNKIYKFEIIENINDIMTDVISDVTSDVTNDVTNDVTSDVVETEVKPAAINYKFDIESIPKEHINKYDESSYKVTLHGKINKKVSKKFSVTFNNKNETEICKLMSISS
jgi:hypothetical protein